MCDDGSSTMRRARKYASWIECQHARMTLGIAWKKRGHSTHTRCSSTACLRDQFYAASFSCVLLEDMTGRVTSNLIKFQQRISRQSPSITFPILLWRRKRCVHARRGAACPRRATRTGVHGDGQLSFLSGRPLDEPRLGGIWACLRLIAGSIFRN